jgi:bifunctional DNA-binding transcriptional regulator/antitoxin component of YhaV-PrlF toxin-antitoxin module
MIARTFSITIAEGVEGFPIALPFDPRAVLGKARAPVKVSLNGHSYRSIIFDMGHGPFVPLRQSNRDAAGLKAGDIVEVTVELDTEKREVTPPDDLAAALDTAGAWEGWNAASFTHKREHVEGIEGARKPETRAKRLEAAVDFARAKQAKLSD